MNLEANGEINDPDNSRKGAPYEDEGNSYLDADGSYQPLEFAKPTPEIQRVLDAARPSLDMNEADKLNMLIVLASAKANGEFSNLGDVLIKLAILLDDFNLEAPAEIVDESSEAKGLLYVSLVPELQYGSETIDIRIGGLTYKVFVFNNRAEVWAVITDDGKGKKVAE